MPSHTGLCKPVAGYVFIVVVFLVHTNAKCHLQFALFYLDLFKHISCRSYITLLLFATITVIGILLQKNNIQKRQICCILPCVRVCS